jgi:hypothetical protein
MAMLYADENFHFPVVMELRNLGYDVLTAYEAGQAGKRIPDPSVLAFAVSIGRAVLTHNRKHFIKLHKQGIRHFGILICTYDEDHVALAQRIHHAIKANSPLDNKLIRVNKPAKP